MRETKWQNETFAAVQRDALVSARALLPPLKLVAVSTSLPQADFVEPHGDAASAELGVLRQAAAKSDDAMGPYWRALEEILDGDVHTTTAQIGHCASNDATAAPHYYRTLIGDYGTVTLVFARRIVDAWEDNDTGDYLCRHLLHASVVLQHAADVLRKGGDHVKTRLDEARFTGGIYYLDATSRLLSSEALLMFALIEGRASLSMPMRASTAWNKLLIPTAADFHNRVPQGTWKGSATVIATAKKRWEQYRALILVDRVHEVEAAFALGRGSDHEQHALRLLRILGVASTYGPTIGPITTRLQQLPAEWLDIHRVRLPSDLVRTQLANIPAATIEEQELTLDATMIDTLVPLCRVWHETERLALIGAFSPLDATGKWAALVQYWIQKGSDQPLATVVADTWTIPMLCIALGKCPDAYVPLLRKRLESLGAPMQEVDAHLNGNLVALMKRLGIEEEQMPVSPPVAIAAVKKSWFQRLFTRDPPPPPPIQIITPLPPPLPVVIDRAATVDDFAVRYIEPLQLDGILPRQDRGMLLQLLSTYTPIEWKRRGLTAAMLRERGVDPATADMTVPGWTLEDVSRAFFS